ncbi:hypothetical protein Patl1_19778 [Pistacia atlantica]|uniref:Uncharacterized protein n=1 Tax=Pistacia atlantica TaxID=434234 RepID=A0ACC1BIJ2_9ROSI|nr:hypothetical protein Patl1_19778 [Pistacia atlantica]
MDYNPGPAKVLRRDFTIEDVEEYFVDFIVNDTLGRLSNAHVAFADKEPMKARSKQCLQLARLSSIAVDFPKIGVAAEIPDELRVKKFPDFMDKPDHMTYQSERVMGRLYRELRSQVLVLEPLPTVNKAYSMALKVEKQREVHINFSDSSSVSAMFAKAQMNQGNNSAKKYGNSELKGHRWGKTNTGGRAMAVQMMDSPLNFEESGEEEKKGLQGQSLTDIIQQEVMKLMKGKMQLENNQVNFAHLGDFAGMNYSLQVIDCLEVGTWIVDTGPTK